MRNQITNLVMAALILLSPFAEAKMYTCVGPNGEKLFQDKPCNGVTNAQYQTDKMREMTTEELLKYMEETRREADEVMSKSRHTIDVVSKLAKCEDVVDLARRVMEFRQNGTAKQVQLTAASSMTEEGRGALLSLIDAAYKVQLHSNPSTRNAAVSEFSLLVRRECVNAYKDELESLQ